jgi:hypothetical protein
VILKLLAEEEAKDGVHRDSQAAPRQRSRQMLPRPRRPRERRMIPLTRLT